VQIRGIAAEHRWITQRNFSLVTSSSVYVRRAYGVVRLISVADDDRAFCRLDDQLVVGEIELEVTLVVERPDVVDQARVGFRKVEPWYLDRVCAAIERWRSSASASETLRPAMLKDDAAE
jgi:hypothetical protein